MNHFVKKPASGRSSIRGEVPSSDEYIDQLKEKQRQVINVPEDFESGGYDSDHTQETFSSRCSFSLIRGKYVKKRNKPTPTAPPSPTPSLNEYVPPTPSLPAASAGVRYSLRSVIGDGTQQPDGPTVMERRHLRPNRSHLRVSHWSAEGLRSYMEDRYVIDDISVRTEDSSSSDTRPSMTLYGVFDGHGGGRASQFCCDRITSYVRHQADFPNDIGRAMKDAFLTIDHDFLQTGFTDGTTACACIVEGGSRIICANVGDSRAITVRSDGSVAKLSRDHKPGVPDETKRISDLGGRIVYWGRWRVEGILAVSRSIGDGALKPFISADPEICDYDISNDDIFLVIASDGIWDVLDNLQVAELLLSQTCVYKNGKYGADSEILKGAARRLCDKAGVLGSTDNLAALVVDLRSYSKKKLRI